MVEVERLQVAVEVGGSSGTVGWRLSLNGGGGAVGAAADCGTEGMVWCGASGT